MAHTAKDAHRRPVWKLDVLLLPCLSTLFFLQSLAKTNLNSTEAVHFPQDIGIPKSAINASIVCFYLTFISLQPVGAVLGQKYGMTRFIPACMVLWGLSTALHAGVRRSWQLVVLRAMIGVFEAGFYATTVTYLSLFYTRYEFVKRLGLFHGLAGIADSFWGLLSWALFKKIPNPKHPDSTLGVLAQRPKWHFPLKPWQSLFLVQGWVMITLAVLAYIWLPHSPGTAWFLSPEERACASARMRRDCIKSYATTDEEMGDNESTYSECDSIEEERKSIELECEDSSSDLTLHDGEEAHDLLNGSRKRPYFSSTPPADHGISRVDIESAFASWHVWYLLVCTFLLAIPANAFTAFLPAVIKGLTYSDSDMGQTGEMAPATASFLITPPYMLAALALWIFTAWSDRHQQRIRPALWGVSVLVIGLSLTLLFSRTALVLRYLALMVLVAGSSVPGPLIVSWLVGNTLEPSKRAVVLGINGWANLAGPFSSLLFSPRFRNSGYALPFVIALLCAGGGFVGLVVFRAAIVAQNNGRLRITGQWSRATTAREALYGDVPVSLRGNWLSRRRSKDVIRKGEERLTYQFTT